MTTPATEDVRALESDTVVREGGLNACIVFLLIRHGALQTASADNPHKDIYRQARDSADREIRWRFAQLEQRAAGLEALAYAPGDWACPTCGFVESKRTLHAPTGYVGVSDAAALPCPNDGQFMARLTWKQHATNVQAIAEDLLQRAVTAEHQRDALAEDVVGYLADFAVQRHASRAVYARALTDAQVCDQEEAERRAARIYPEPVEGS